MNPYRIPPKQPQIEPQRPCERQCGRLEVVEIVNDRVAIYLCEACADLAEKQYEEFGPWQRFWILTSNGN